MNNVIDFTTQIKNKACEERISKVLLDVSELINEGYIKEIVGVLVDNNDNYYALMPTTEIKLIDFKQMLNDYADKIPTTKKL